MNMRRLQGLSFNVLRSKGIGLLIVGCLLGMLGPINLAQGETVGERFRKQMEKMAAMCKAQKLSPTDTRCILPNMKPADPLATEEGRFAHAIKIPNPVPEDSGYKPGMTPEQYFDHLCKTEAGEFIYKTVENVEGVYQMRPRGRATDHMLQHLYAVEDNYDYQEWEIREPQKFFIRPSAYSFFETSSEGSGSGEGGRKYKRYSGKNPDTSRDMMLEIVMDQPVGRHSRYGYTWRGIRRSTDRDLGIVGGELIVMDLQASDVLAVHRGFVRAVWDDRVPGGFRWENICPKDKTRLLYTYEFISRVLKPLSMSNRGGQNATK